MDDGIGVIPQRYLGAQGNGWWASDMHAFAGGAVWALLAQAPGANVEILNDHDGNHTPLYRLSHPDLAEFGIESIILEAHPPKMKEPES